MPPRKGQAKKQVIERLQDAAAAVVQRMSGGRPGAGQPAHDVTADGSTGTESIEVLGEHDRQQLGEPVHIDTSRRQTSWLNAASAQWASRHRLVLGTSIVGVLLLALIYQANTTVQMARHADAQARKLGEIVAEQLIASNNSKLAYTEQLQGALALVAEYQSMARKADIHAQSVEKKLQTFIKEHQANQQTAQSLQLQMQELEASIAKQPNVNKPLIVVQPHFTTPAYAQLEAHTATPLDSSLRRRVHTVLHKLFHPSSPPPILPSARLAYMLLVNGHEPATVMNMQHTLAQPCFLQLVSKPTSQGQQPSVTFTFEHPITNITHITYKQGAVHAGRVTSPIFSLPSQAHISAQISSTDWMPVAVVDLLKPVETAGVRKIQLPRNVSSKTVTRVRVEFVPDRDLKSSNKELETVICAPAVLFHTSS